MLKNWSFPWKCWDLRIKKLGKIKSGAAFPAALRWGWNFWEFRDKMEQPRDGEKRFLVEFRNYSQKIPNFSPKRIFPTQYPEKFSPCAHFGIFPEFFPIQNKQFQEFPDPSLEFQGFFSQGIRAGNSDVPKKNNFLHESF